MSDHALTALIFASPFVALASIFATYETARIVAANKEQGK